METFAQSIGGRLVMAANAVFLGTSAAYLLTGSLYTWGIGMPIGLTLAFVGVGLSMTDYLRETMFSITVLPTALWGFTYLLGELDWRAITWPAYIIGALAVLALYRAAVPPSAEQAA